MTVMAQISTTTTSKLNNVPAEPFVKWAGGKRQLLTELRKYIPIHFNRYIEPFLGGGALFFDMLPQKAVINDSNFELMNAYLMIKENVEELIQTLKYYEYNDEFYYFLRAQNTALLDRINLAARFIYLNKCCYNGLYRVNKSGKFNVPIGRYTNPQICNSEKLRAASHALQNTAVESLDYKELLCKYAKKGDFIYIDPPYHPISEYSDFRRYTKEFFYENDQIELRDMISELKNFGCVVIASNSYCDFILDIYKDFKIKIVEVRRHINKCASGRSAIKEVIIL